MKIKWNVEMSCLEPVHAKSKHNDECYPVSRHCSRHGVHAVVHELAPTLQLHHAVPVQTVTKTYWRKMQRPYTVNMAGPKESNDDLEMLEVL